MAVIGKGAFENCSSLEYVPIPAGVSEIGAYAFRNCVALRVINFAGTKKQWVAIKKGKDWDSNTGDYVVRCIDGDIKKKC